LKVTSVVTQRATESDDAGLPATLQRQEALGLERPTELYADGAYISGRAIHEAKQAGWQLVGPAQPSAARAGLRAGERPTWHRAWPYERTNGRGQLSQRMSMMLGITGGITEPLTSCGSGLTCSHSGCGPGRRLLPGAGSCPRRLYRRRRVTSRTPGRSLRRLPGRIGPAHNHRVNRDINRSCRGRVSCWARRNGAARRGRRSGKAPLPPPSWACGLKRNAAKSRPGFQWRRAGTRRAAAARANARHTRAGGRSRASCASRGRALRNRARRTSSPKDPALRVPWSLNPHSTQSEQGLSPKDHWVGFYHCE